MIVIWLMSVTPSTSLPSVILASPHRGRGEDEGVNGAAPHRLSRRLAAWLLRLPLKGGVISSKAQHSHFHPLECRRHACMRDWYENSLIESSPIKGEETLRGVGV